MPRLSLGLKIVLALTLLGEQVFGLAGQFPSPVGYVNDFANIISDDAEQLLDDIASQVKARTGAEIAVVTIATTSGEDIEQYAVELFMAWGIGEKGKDNGILLLVAYDDRRLWIKTGYGLEDVVPDAEAHRIYRDILRPGFRQGRIDEALAQAVKEIATLILRASGESLSLSDSTLFNRLTTQTELKQSSSKAPPVWLLLLVPGIIALGISLWIVFRLRGYTHPGGGFWIGTTGGSSGSFGGGFGGFGGGGCGGGGAGGGW